VAQVQQFLRIFVDIVLWRRGPQDLPASTLLLGVAVAAYVAVSVVQLALLGESAATWFLFTMVDPLLLGGWVWLVLRLFSKPERFLQTASAVFGAGAVLGLALYLPLQLVATAFGGSGGKDIESLPTTVIKLARLVGGISPAELFTEVGLTPSRGEAKRLISQGGLYVNDERIDSLERVLTAKDLGPSGILLKAGKKKIHRVVVD